MTVTMDKVSESFAGSIKDFKTANVDSTSCATVVGSSSWSLSIVLATAICLLLLKRWLFSKKLNLPPGPQGWPIIGSLLELEPRFYRSFTRLAQRYGPIMHMKLGACDTVVISGVKEAEVLFKSRDLEFASRPSKSILRLATKYIGFNGTDVVFGNYTPRMKVLKKLCMTELLSTTQLKGQLQLRTNEVNRLVQDFAAVSDKGESLQLRDQILNMVTNMTSVLLFGKRLCGDDLVVDPELQAFRILMHDMITALGTMNAASLIPALQWLDPTGLLPSYKSIQTRLISHFGRMVAEHRQARATVSIATEQTAEKKVKDFCDVLLDYERDSNEKLSDNEMMGVLLDLLAGGTDNSASSTEWALAEIIHQPSVLQRLQEEIDNVVGYSRAVEESDLRSMPLLDAILKETFRLHPPLPVLMPHSNEEATTLGGYDIPQDTCLFVNIWAIGRDPALWDNALNFDPDRFLGTHSKITMGGSSFELLPFGTGRRVCAGTNLGILSVKYPIAAMVHAFDLSPAPGQKTEDISFEEDPAIALRMSVPMVATAKARATAKYYKACD